MKINRMALSISLSYFVLGCAPDNAPLMQSRVKVFQQSKNLQQQPGRKTATISVRLQPRKFKIQAGLKTNADVASYELKLMGGTGFTTVVQTITTATTTAQFTNITNGTYRVEVKALDGTNTDITEGGPAISSNTVTVSNGTVSYSAGTALSVTIPLKNGTGGRVSIAVNTGVPPTGINHFLAAIFDPNNQLVRQAIYNTGTNDTTFGFTPVADGTYKAVVQAIDATGQTIGFATGSTAMTTITNGGDATGNPLNITMEYDRNISTFIGGGNFNGQNPTTIGLAFPRGVQVDAAGNIYISHFKHKIEKIDTAGNLSAFAGNHGVSGSIGDGGAASLASFNNPYGMDFDSAGNMYLADANNHKIRKIDTAGIITTVAGDGTNAFGGDGGAATAAQINTPRDVDIYMSPVGEQLVIADRQNDRIRMVCFNSGTVLGQVMSAGNIYTIAGTGTGGSSGDGGPATVAQIDNPEGLFFDSTTQNLYIADSTNRRVRSVDSTGNITTVAGDGSTAFTDGVSATATGVNRPFDVAVDSAGHMYIATQLGRRVRMVAGSTGTFYGQSMLTGNIYTLHGDGTTGVLNNPQSITFNPLDQSVIVTNNNKIIERIASDGTVTTIAGSGGAESYFGDGIGREETLANDPRYATFDKTGNLYFVDQANAVLRKWNAQTNQVTLLAGTPNSTGSSGDGGPATAAQLQNPLGIAVDDNGNVYVSDSSNHKIRKIDAGTGVITTIAGIGSAGFGGDGNPASTGQLSTPRGLAFDTAGNLYIGDSGNDRVRMIDTVGNLSTIAGDGTNASSGDGNPATNAQVNAPTGVFVDILGNLFISCDADHIVRKVDTAGIISTIAGTNGTNGSAGDGGAATAAQLNSPRAITMDFFGNLYIADRSNDKIRKVDSSGFITTVVGNGTGGFAGDGSLASASELSNPEGVAIDASGNLYIVDTTNDRIRKLVAP